MKAHITSIRSSSGDPGGALRKRQPQRASRLAACLPSTLFTILLAAAAPLMMTLASSGPAEAAGASPFSPGSLAAPTLGGRASSPTATPESSSTEASFTLHPYDEPPVVFATRAFVQDELVPLGKQRAEAEVIYRAEYGSSGREGVCEVGEGGSRTLVNEAHIPLTGEYRFPSIGEHNPTEAADTRPWEDLVLRHLPPETTYYVRFEAIEAAHSTETWEEAVARLGDAAARCEEVKFTTLALQKPEVSGNPSAGRIGPQEFHPASVTQRTASFVAQIESNGSSTKYEFEYAAAKGGPWVEFPVGGSGMISEAEEYVVHEAEITGLQPETEYYARITMTNSIGTTVQSTFYGGVSGSSPGEAFITPTARPRSGGVRVVNPRATTARFFGEITPDGAETSWQFQTATSPNGPWSPVVGASGTTEALPEGRSVIVEGAASGLQSGTLYYVRAFVSSASGEGVEMAVTEFETAGPPVVSTSPIHAVEPGGMRLLARVNPGSIVTDEEQTITLEGAPSSGSFTLSFEGQAGEPIPFNANSSEVERALAGIAGLEGNVKVYGVVGGPFTVVWVNADAGVDVPELVAVGSGMTVGVATRQQGGEGYDQKLGFEYVTQAQFEASGFAEAQSTVEQPVDDPSQAVQELGVDAFALEPGQQYQYRAYANSTFPGGEHIVGETVALSVPAESSESEAECPNAASRRGFAAELPDCRAYEQLTPIDKEGAQEAYNYGPKVESGAVVGEQGEALAFESPSVAWGTAPTSGQAPYLFSREAGKSWSMVVGSPQPESGVELVTPQLFSDDARQVASQVEVHTSLGSGQSPEVSFVTGPVGGPYAMAAVVPRVDMQGRSGVSEGWVAASEDFRTLILQVEDHTLLGASTGTKHGNDLYEYAGGELRQVNVGVGVCGAQIASGEEADGTASSSHAVSSDGSVVFFEATPGRECEAPMHLYARRDGAETIDLGEYRFAGANSQGSEVLLEEPGSVTKYFIDDLESGVVNEIFAGQIPGPREGSRVSADFTAVYFDTKAHEIYRYDVGSGELEYLFRAGAYDLPGVPGANGASYYFEGTIEGVPGKNQVFLYDHATESLTCVSCTSYDPEPKLGAYFPHSSADLATWQSTNGQPAETFVSENGDFAFFDTPSALVPGDVDGEIEPNYVAGAEFQSQEFSQSSDVYEWRADGVDGCGQINGCVALLTNGRGGYLNLLIGSDPSGSNVFIYTRSQLLPQDNDNAGDIYDARIDGGLPEPPNSAAECAADACVKPTPAPNDATPASETFNGAGDTLALGGSESTSGHGEHHKRAHPAKHKHGPKKKHKRGRKHRSRSRHAAAHAKGRQRARRHEQERSAR